jgi:hypothetical protein
MEEKYSAAGTRLQRAASTKSGDVIVKRKNRRTTVSLKFGEQGTGVIALKRLRPYT